MSLVVQHAMWLHVGAVRGPVFEGVLESVLFNGHLCVAHMIMTTS